MAPGRPRSAAVDAAIGDAALTLLHERGYAATSIEAVAAAAGVAKTAIYRRWRSKAEMIFSIAVHDAAIAPPVDSGTLADDLRALVRRVVELLTTPTARVALPGLIADLRDDPELERRFTQTFIEPERALVRTLLVRARDRGETPALAPDSAPDVHAQLLGTVFAWTALVGDGPPPDLVDRLTLALLAAIPAIPAIPAIQGDDR